MAPVVGADGVARCGVEADHERGLMMRGSFDDVREAVRRSIGQRLGKRQLEELVQRAATDFDAWVSRTFDEAERSRYAAEQPRHLAIAA